MYIENKVINKYISFWLISIFIIVSLMIIVGGLTRLTDSGLSITEWELFTGILPPFNTKQWNMYFDLYKQIPEYKLQNYLMTLSEFKIIFWWEFIHRFLGRLIGMFFLFPLIFFTFKLGFKKTINFHVIFLLICLQGFIGWYMVSSGLVNRVDVSHYRLALHLVVAFIILSLVFWNYLKYSHIITPAKKTNNFFIICFIILLYIQLTIGAFVSGMDAGKIYNSWPFMGTGYFPDDNKIINLFTLSAFNEPSLVQFIHRNLAYIILILYLYIFFKFYNLKLLKYFKILKIIGILLIIQILLGIITLLSGAQMFVSSMHQISSIFLISSSIYLLYLNTKTS
jgi:cytochrome c oxidase assembly protein subunit 15